MGKSVLKFLPENAAAALIFIFNIFEKQMAQHPLGKEITQMIDSYGWHLFYLFLGISIGHIYADLINKKHSDIKSGWKSLWRIFDVVSTHVDSGMTPRRLEAKTRIKFVKAIKKGSLILRVYSLTGLNRPPIISVIHLEQINNTVKDEVRDIVLATKAIAHPGWIPFHSSIGPTDNSNEISNIVTLCGSSKNVLELELKTRFFSQKTQFFIEDISYASSEYGFGLYAINEEDDLFKI